jgi:hypothetical protein
MELRSTDKGFRRGQSLKTSFQLFSVEMTQNFLEQVSLESLTLLLLGTVSLSFGINSHTVEKCN